MTTETNKQVLLEARDGHKEMNVSTTLPVTEKQYRKVRTQTNRLVKKLHSRADASRLIRSLIDLEKGVAQ